MSFSGGNDMSVGTSANTGPAIDDEGGFDIGDMATTMMKTFEARKSPVSSISEAFRTGDGNPNLNQFLDAYVGAGATATHAAARTESGQAYADFGYTKATVTNQMPDWFENGVHVKFEQPALDGAFKNAEWANYQHAWARSFAPH